jgi:hypothetical protein
MVFGGKSLSIENIFRRKAVQEKGCAGERPYRRKAVLAIYMSLDRTS